jgi:spore maturation protein CgeB
MKLVVFGLTISSSWGNGHATLWRGLCRALANQRHRVVFFEHDLPYYAGNRDLWEMPGVDIVLYDDWPSVAARARAEMADADVGIVTSYCPDALAAGDLLHGDGRALSVFYDLDTPVTLSRLGRGESVPYIGARGLSDFDLVLSYTGGAALHELRSQLGARVVKPLYGHVDPDVHRHVPTSAEHRFDMSYLGTYSDDRQRTLDLLLIEAARRRPAARFLIGGAQYPQNFPWQPNLFFQRHLPPTEHPKFFSSSRLTLNVTREPMAALGWCPSGRLFEAAACGTALVSDLWDGLDAFFAIGEEIFIARETNDVLAMLDLPNADIARVGTAGRERVLSEHTSARRAAELICMLEGARTDIAHLEPSGA